MPEAGIKGKDKQLHPTDTVDQHQTSPNCCILSLIKTQMLPICLMCRMQIDENEHGFSPYFLTIKIEGISKQPYVR